jgi:hypothetical protein
MKYSKAEVHRKTHGLPALRFEDSQMTSFSGLILLQALFTRLGLKERLRRCFSHLTVSPIFGHATLVLCLVLHLMLGYRRLRDISYYSDDPLVMRTLGLRRLPDVATLSRGLARADAESVKRLQGLVREGVVTRLVALGLSRVTLDFDGSVIRHREIGRGHRSRVQPQEEPGLHGRNASGRYRKKGQRSYYPLFCTAAQTGQVLNVLHRSGNVHDSRGQGLHPLLYRYRAGGPARGLYRGAHGQRLFQ